MSETSTREILWLEDVPKSIQANVHVLTRSGFNVVVARSLEGAKEAAHQKQFVAIIVDYSVPKYDDDRGEADRGLGMAFIKMLKQGEFGEQNAKAKVVLCTAQRESIGQDRGDLARMNIDILPKSSSYVSIVNLAKEMSGAV